MAHPPTGTQAQSTSDTPAPPPPQAITDRVRIMLAIADQARGITLPLFTSPDQGVETKRDGTPVTEADRACEDLIRTRLGEAFPNDAVLGEERDNTTGSSGFRWLIDPIDGTFSFTRGVPLWSTLIALEHESRPGWACAGLIDLPALGERVHASLGSGAWHTTGDAEPRPARVSSIDDPKTACVCITSTDVFASDRERAAFDRVQAMTGHTRGWSDAYAPFLVATGRAEAALDAGVEPYDIAPWTIIAAEAGGTMTDWQGQRRFDSGNALMTNGVLHDALLGTLGG